MDHFNNKEQEFKSVLSGLDLDLDLDQVWNDVEGQLTFKDNDRVPLFIRILSGFVLTLTLFIFVQSFFLETDSPIVDQITENVDNTYASQSAITSISSISKDDRSKNVNAKNDKQDLISDAVVEKVETNNRVAERVVQESMPITSGQQVSISKDGGFEKKQLSRILAKGPFTDTDLKKENRVLETNPRKFPLLPINGSLFNVSERMFPNLEISLAQPMVIEPVKISKWSPLYSATIGSNLSQNGIQIIDSELRNKDNKAQYEQGLFGLSGSMIAGLENDKGFRFYGGIEISRSVIRFTDKDLEESASSSIGTTSFRIDEDGDITSQSGTISSNTLTQHDVKWHRRHTNFDLVLGIGKRMSLGKGFHFDLSGGASLNIHSLSSGYIFRDDLESITKFQSDNNEYYKSNWGLGMHARLGIEKDINEVLSLGLYGSGTHYFSAINSETQLFNIRNSRIGLQFGITYRPIRE